MVATNFEQALKWVLEYEGGWTNDPHDPGGATMFGIIQREYDAYRKEKKLLPQSVRHISTAERDEIYKRSYWDVMDCDALPAGVDACAFDAAVNSGPGRAKQWLAASGHPVSIDAFCDHRLAFLQALKTWRYFGKGWASRVALVRRRCKALAASNSPSGDAAQTSKPTPGASSMTTSPAVSANPVVAAAVKAATTPIKSLWSSVTGMISSVVTGGAAAVVTSLAPNLTIEILAGCGVAAALVSAAAHFYALVSGQIATNNATIALAENLLNEIETAFGGKPIVFDNNPPTQAAAS